MKVMMIGSFSIDDGDGSENVTFRMNSRFLNFVAFIPICRKCLMQANFPGLDNLGTALKFRKREKSSSWVVYALHKKSEIRHFHVVVVQGRQRNVQKSAMHVLGCCFAQQTYCFDALVAVAVFVAKAP